MDLVVRRPHTIGGIGEIDVTQPDLNPVRSRALRAARIDAQRAAVSTGATRQACRRSTSGAVSPSVSMQRKPRRGSRRSPATLAVHDRRSRCGHGEHEESRGREQQAAEHSLVLLALDRIRQAVHPSTPGGSIDGSSPSLTAVPCASRGLELSPSGASWRFAAATACRSWSA